MRASSYSRGEKVFASMNYRIPKIQRKLIVENVDKIYEIELSWYATHGCYLLAKTISIAIWNSQEYIIDGQHRMCAYKRLSKEHPEREIILSVEYYHCDTKEALENEYKYVNMSTPNDISRMDITPYKNKEEVISLFEKNFLTYLKNTNKPISPNINIKIIRDKLDGIPLGDFSVGELTKYFLELNLYYSKCPLELFRKWHVETRAITTIKQRPTQLYLGLYRNYEYIDRIVQLKTLRETIPSAGFAHIEHYSNCYRVKISKGLRRAVWNSKLTTQDCYCCGELIDIDNFHCGHIQPVSYGGPTTADNLRPVCSQCNKDMGVMNMNDYIKLLKEQTQ